MIFCKLRITCNSLRQHPAAGFRSNKMIICESHLDELLFSSVCFLFIFNNFFFKCCFLVFALCRSQANKASARIESAADRVIAWGQNIKTANVPMEKKNVVTEYASRMRRSPLAARSFLLLARSCATPRLRHRLVNKQAHAVLPQKLQMSCVPPTAPIASRRGVRGVRARRAARQLSAAFQHNHAFATLLELGSDMAKIA